nr:reverse transcriptase domain-containing protein [Tanacetum cinerariifolium]
GNLLERRTQDVLTIIENKSKTSAVTIAMTAILKQFQATPPPASDNIQGYILAVAINYNQGNSVYRPLGAARRWLEKEPSHSIHTLEDLVSKFINEFFPPSRTTNLRNKISNFQQRFDESFHEAWDRYKDLLHAFPHHGFTEFHQLDTFYNALNPSDQDSLNAAAGGNLLERRTQDVLTIIENKSKNFTIFHIVYFDQPRPPEKDILLKGMISSTSSHLESIPVLKYTLYPFYGVLGKTCTTYSSSPNQLFEELALITFPPKYDDDLQFEVEFDLKEIEFLLHQDIDSSLKDSIDQSNLANLADNFVDSMPEIIPKNLKTHAKGFCPPVFISSASLGNYKIPLCYDDDDDEESSIPLRDIIIFELPPCIAITPFVSTNYSLIMEDEHLNTIPGKESDEFIKSSVENLVPNPRNLFEPFFDEEIISIKIDPHHFNAESDLIKSLLNQDSSIISSSKIDSLLDEFAGELILLKSIPPRIDEADCNPEEEICLFEKFFDSLMEEIDLFLTVDDSMLPGIENDDYDSEGDILILEELLNNDSLSLSKNESFHYDIPSSPRPPAKPPDDDEIEPNLGILTIKVVGDISEHYVPVPRLLPTQPTHASNQEKYPHLLSHRDLKAFQLSSKSPMMIHGGNIPILDVPFLSSLTSSSMGGIGSS